MSSHFSAIRQALETRLTTLPSVPTIVWENSTLNPPDTDTHIISVVIFDDRVPAVRGLNPQQRYEGSYRLEARVAEGGGPGVADALADSVIEHFDSHTDLVHTDLVVRIDESYRGQGFMEDGWYVVPMTVLWYAYK